MSQANHSVLSNEEIEVADELNKIQIEQLHKATLNFSDNSLETKKLCITVEVAAFTGLTGIYKGSPPSDLMIILRFFGIVIPFLFYIVDVVLYYYQDKLREKMLDEENEIRCRHRLRDRPCERSKDRLFRAFINPVLFTSTGE